jgi:4-amino-4-deoxychorismate lyase
VLKLLLTRGSGGRGYAPPPAPTPTRVLAVYPWPAHLCDNADKGVRVRVCCTRLGGSPALAGIKHLNRLEQVLARAEWSDEYADGLMLDAQGDVIEGTMSNVLAVLDGRLVTPDVSRCGVAGVMRGLIMERARDILPTAVTRVSLADLVRATEVFLANSIIGIWPVTQLDTEDIPGGGRTYARGPITRQLQQRIADALPAP